MVNASSSDKAEGSVSVFGGGKGDYHSTPLSKIPDALSRLFRDLQKSSDVYSRAASTNVLIPVRGADSVAGVERLIDSVARFHPSRFFIFGNNDKLSSVAAEVSARCYFTSKGGGSSQHICSELVRLAAPAKSLRELVGVLRASLVTATPTELFLFDALVDDACLLQASVLADQLILDSSMWIGRTAVLEKLFSGARSVVDLQWVALGAWRDQIRLMFDQPMAQGLPVGLTRVVLECDRSFEQSPKAEMPMCTLLLAGWISTRLGLQLTGYRAGVFDFTSPLGSVVTVEIKVADTPPVTPVPSTEEAPLVHSPGGLPMSKFLASSLAPEPRMARMRFDGIGRGGKSVSVEIQRANQVLEARLKGEQSMVSTRPLEDEGGEARLHRYFLIGESTANYLHSALVAFSMNRACR